MISSLYFEKDKYIAHLCLFFIYLIAIYKTISICAGDERLHPLEDNGQSIYTEFAGKS